MQNTKFILSMLLSTLMMSYFSTAIAADVNAGADSYDANCAECHSIAKPLKNKKGPGLLGVVGRQSATITGFDYSEGMKSATFSWTPENLDNYIANPKLKIPNGKMKFKGLANTKERADLIEFLSQQK